MPAAAVAAAARRLLRLHQPANAWIGLLPILPLALPPQLTRTKTRMSSRRAWLHLRLPRERPPRVSAHECGDAR